MLRHPGAGASPAADRDVQAGKVLYDRQCASCHGPGGKGDGPSAGGLATRPADLSDGRLMNPLPDEWLVSIIRGGGPAEGLAPTMPPFEKFLNPDQTRHVVAYVRTLAQPAYRGDAKPLVHVEPAPRQPIFFSHVIHAGSFGIACQHCHADARRSDYAGIPSTERCLGCHKIIGAQDNPEIMKIHEYAQRGEPIPWVRVFKVPEFTYFPHKPHVRAGVECQTCHGPVERMRVVGAQTGTSLGNDLLNLVGIRTAPPPLSMGWCIDCHRAENAKGARAPLDCVTCHH
ncbi:MAG: c-type cytochrome [Candidatus Rokubacteria bacterium]|nr:c-type cytochrome [Candidatus Rokubacteria bacterium]